MQKTNLLQRLNPQVADLLYADQKEFPLYTRELMQHLLETYWVNDLRYKYVIALESYALKAGLKISDMYELFEFNQ